MFLESDFGFLEHEPLYPLDEAAWPPSDSEDAADVQLVACATLAGEQPLSPEQSCAFGLGRPTTLPMVSATYQVRVYELRTHREVRSITVQGLDTECPPAISASPTPERLLSRPTFAQWQETLGDLVDQNR